MELEAQSAADAATSTSMVPQKRKTPPAEGDFPPGTFKAAQAPTSAESAANIQSDKDEYETGRVLCEACGDGISFRDEATGTFTVKHWDAHRVQCPNASQQAVKTVSHSPEPQPVVLPPPPATKRRRAKRTEDERIAYLRDDPYVAQFEAYRVLCASCDKWIRLRPNSTYCSIPWDAHRKSCLAKRVAKNSRPGQDRSILFSNDPNVRKFDSERVQCVNCEEWVALGSGDNLAVVQKWAQHRTSCPRTITQGSTNGPNLSPSMTLRPTIDSVPPPSKHLMALVSSSALPKHTTSNPARVHPSVHVLIPPTLSVSSFKDLNPGNFVPAHESRRRNAEQREAALRSDPLIMEVEPNRVFCSVCSKWVQLRQDSTYCAYPWVQHRSKCLARHQRKLGKESDASGMSAELQKALELHAKFEHDVEDSEDDSEMSASSDEELRALRHARRREERRKAKEQAWMVRLNQEEHCKLACYQRTIPSAVKEEDTVMEVDTQVGHPARLADLDTPSGRIDFVDKSIRYLFKSTYERSDDLTIATLVTYLNAAIPPDKHEDFDTTEVTKAAAAISDRGDFVLEGDVLRICD